MRSKTGWRRGVEKVQKILPRSEERIFELDEEPYQFRGRDNEEQSHPLPLGAVPDLLVFCDS